jgi:sec-independent protein translocase protein TatB
VFDISFTELMLIGVVALVVIGPERLPKLARTVGHLLGRAQRYVNDVKGDIQREVELEELRKMKEEMESAANSMQSSFTQAESSLRESIHEPISDLQLDGEPKQNLGVESLQSQPEVDLKGDSPPGAERKQ